MRDPLTTKKIQFIKSILKKHALTAKENKKIFHHNNKIVMEHYRHTQQNIKYRSVIYLSSQQVIDLNIKDYIESGYNDYTITLIHVYYLRLKESSKFHTKDDSKYEASSIYKSIVSELEKKFLVSCDVGTTGLYVAIN